MLLESRDMSPYRSTAFFQTSSLSNLNMSAAKSLSLSQISVLLPPVSGVPEVAVDGALRDFGDDGEAAFEMGVHDTLVHLIDEPLVEARVDELRARIALIDHEVKQPVDVAVAEAQLTLVRLPLPEIGRRIFFHDDRRHADGLRQRPHLRFVEIAEQIDRRRHVAVKRAVAQEQLGLVAGARSEEHTSELQSRGLIS